MTLTLSPSNAATEQRDTHVKAALDFFEQARQQADSGMISEAGSSILKGLAQERRAKSTGPQVLQLIKPRS